MNAFFIHTTSYGSICSDYSYLLISSFHYFFCTRDSYTENVFSWENLILKPTKSMNTRCVTSKYNYISSLIKKLLYSDFRKFSNFSLWSISIRSIFPIHFEDHSYFWKCFLKNLHHKFSSKPRIKESKNHKKRSGLNLILIFFIFLQNYFFIPIKSCVFFIIFRPTAIRRIRETHIAVKRERTIPRASIRPKPLMRETPAQ